MKKVLFTLIAVALFAFAIYYFSSLRQGPETSDLASDNIYGGIGSAVANPVAEMPSANPLEKTVNPYTSAYRNPFNQ